MTTYKNTHHFHAWLAISLLAILLTACGGGGSSTSSAPPPASANNIAPIASFTPSLTTPVVGQSVTFDPVASSDKDGTIANYQWDFGDGQTRLMSTKDVVSHVYTSTGTYTATLSVFDNGGKSNSTSVPMVVGLTPNKAPVANFQASSTTALVGQALTFNPISSSDPDGVIVSYVWDFGDGNNKTNNSSASVNNSFSAVGTYIVRLTVTDDKGAMHVATQVIQISVIPNAAPVASFLASSTTAVVGQSITLNPTASSDADGTIVSYAWNFGDGITKLNTNDAIEVHSFSSVGSFALRLTVTDNRGATHLQSQTILVAAVPNIAPVANFTSSSVTAIVGQSLTFNPIASSDSDGSILNYAWNFGDGFVTSNGVNGAVNHGFASVGNFTVSLTVTDNKGATHTSSQTIAVSAVPNIAPVASFVASSATAVTGQTLSFNPAASADSDGTIVSYAWNFGDGRTQTNSSNAVITHSFTAVGTYAVSLAVTDNRGGIHSVAQSIVVSLVPNIAPVASYTPSTISPVANQTVSFNPAASADTDGSIVSYSWNFGDGTVVTNATNAQVTRAFSRVGNYDVVLTVVDNRGASHVSTQTIYVGRVLSDTGQSSCYDALGIILGSCTGTGADGEFGLDSNVATNSNADGILGFNYSKLDSTGNVLAAGAASWDCITDKVTGLTWENKNTSAAHVQFASHTYTWYSTNTTSNGGSVGATGANTCAATLTGNLCNSQAYVSRINATGMCGKTDWRLPTASELTTLVHWGAAANPRVDTSYFPNLQAGSYWTSTPNPFNVLDAYSFSFVTRTLGTATKTTPSLIQLVRGTP